MIRTAPGKVSGDVVSLVLLPHRSLTRPGLVAFLLGQSLVAGGYALLAAWGGNVFAPVFAVVELAVVVYCLVRVWRASAAGQIITLTPEQLDIAPTSGTESAHFHPYWAQVRLEEGTWRSWPSRLLVGSHGRFVEVGAFLNEDERRVLAQRLTELLRSANARGGTNENSKGEKHEGCA
jgi:uncharacterized membrane protein